MLFYHDVPGATQSTNGSANTPNDCFFIKPGSLRAVWVTAILPTGRGAGLTSISGISYRLERWSTTASSGGTALTPTPDDEGYQAAQHTAGWAAGAVTSGTGGPTLALSVGSGATSPGNWEQPDINKCPMLQAGENKSLDVFNVSGTISLPFELSVGTAE